MSEKRKRIIYIGLAISSVLNFVFILLIASVIYLLISGYGYGFNIQKFISGQITKAQSSSQIQDKTLTGLPEDFNVLPEVWNIIKNTYVDKKELDAKKVSQGAAKGLVEGLGDPYSSYSNPEMYKRELESLKGRFEGIGATVGMKDKVPTIIAPITGSPAEAANLKSGDKILEVDGKSTNGMSLDDVVLRIKGPAGTTVKLLILHEKAEQPVLVEIVRKEINLTTVSWKIQDNIAYIKLSQFIETTANDLYPALKEIMNKNVAGMVLDLRNNGGGLLNVVIDVAGQFMDGGVVINVIDSDGQKTSLPAKKGGLATKVPLIVLVNEGSASGAEVLAGALQDHNRAKLAGNTTFGKGSVQTIRTLKDGSALRVTVARYYTPLDRPVDGKGLKPDFPLDLKGDELIDWAINYLKSQQVTSIPSATLNIDIR